MPETHPISGACVWHGREMANSPRWRRRLGDAQLAEIDRSFGELLKQLPNKAEMGARLAAGRVPTPRTLLAPGAPLTAASRIERFPLVLKPAFGDNGRDVRVIRDRAELERLGWSEPLVLAQEFIAGDGHELKLYVIGHDVWAVRRPAMLLADGRADGPPAAPPAGEAVPLRPGERDLALCCKRLFGLELFGLDCIRTPSGTVVIEVNDFPNYGSVPSASERLADFVMKRARATRRRT